MEHNSHHSDALGQEIGLIQLGPASTRPYPDDAVEIDNLLRLDDHDFYSAQPTVTSPHAPTLAYDKMPTDADFANMIDPDLVVSASVDDPAERTLAVNDSMDLDMLSTQGRLASTSGEDIGHSLQFTTEGHMKYMGIVDPNLSQLAGTFFKIADLVARTSHRTQHVGERPS